MEFRSLHQYILPAHVMQYFVELVGSDIYEDPAVMYEGVAENPEPISVDTYLMPYNKDFSLGFVQGTDQAQKQEEEQPEQEVQLVWMLNSFEIQHVALILPSLLRKNVRTNDTICQEIYSKGI